MPELDEDSRERQFRLRTPKLSMPLMRVHPSAEIHVGNPADAAPPRCTRVSILRLKDAEIPAPENTSCDAYSTEHARFSTFISVLAFFTQGHV